MSTEQSITRSTTGVVEQPARAKRRKVVHLHWAGDMEAAEAMRVQCRTLCGQWVFLHRKPEDRDKPRDFLETVGGLVPLPEPEDCKNCLRSWVAVKRRQFDQGAR